MEKPKIKKGDQVRVVSGKETGKSGKVMRVDREHHRVFVERLNLMKKHTKPHPKKNPQGGIIEREAPIDISNVMLICPACGEPTRVGYHVHDDGRKVRACRREACGQDIDRA
jgi:large subunit ribosomal protein L24